MWIRRKTYDKMLNDNLAMKMERDEERGKRERVEAEMLEAHRQNATLMVALRALRDVNADLDRKLQDANN